MVPAGFSGDGRSPNAFEPLKLGERLPEGESSERGPYFVDGLFPLVRRSFALRRFHSARRRVVSD